MKTTPITQWPHLDFKDLMALHHWQLLWKLGGLNQTKDLQGMEEKPPAKNSNTMSLAQPRFKPCPHHMS